MGLLTNVERIIELETSNRVLVEEVARLRVDVDRLNEWQSCEFEKRRKISEKMKKARAGRKRK